MVCRALLTSVETLPVVIIGNEFPFGSRHYRRSRTVNFWCKLVKEASGSLRLPVEERSRLTFGAELDWKRAGLREQGAKKAG